MTKALVIFSSILCCSVAIAHADPDPLQEEKAVTTHVLLNGVNVVPDWDHSSDGTGS